MEISRRDRRALLLGGVGLGLIAMYFLAIEPLASAYAKLVADHDRLAAKVARRIHDNRKAEYYAGRLKEYEQTAGELSGPKPYDEQITAVGEQIIAAAQKSGVQLRGATPTAAVPWGNDPTLEMALFHIDGEVRWENLMTAGRGWENVFKFIANLYRIPGVLSVERLDLSGERKKGSPNDPSQGGKIALRLAVSVLVEATPSREEPWAR